jgi:dihydropteroate synthase
MLLRACQHEFRFPRPALVMGIVNVTPDSFSDGGHYLDTGAAVAHALEMVAQGAEILDIGGESTRPRATPVPEEEELRRVMPVLKRLAEETRVPLSIDTMKPEVARAAVEAGATIINDVATNRTDPEMWRIAARSGAAYVAVHMQGTPATMQQEPHYENVTAEVFRFFAERINRFLGCGMTPEQIILDPGIGFGKTAGHNLELLARLGEFRRLGRPLLVGVSRKSFLGAITGAGVAARLPGALACAALGAEAGMNIVRVHDVAETVQAVRIAEAILAKKTTA